MSVRQSAGARAATGIAGLDEMLGGGIPRGRTILVIGEPGSGKTVLAAQFLMEGIGRSENAVYVSLKEAKRDFFSDMSCFGWDFGNAEKSGKFQFLNASPFREVGEANENTVSSPNFSVGALLEAIKTSAQTAEAKRIVVDALSTLAMTCSDPVKRIKLIFDVITTLRETPATSLVISDYPSQSAGPFIELEEYIRDRNRMEIEKHLVHGIITLGTLFSAARFDPAAEETIRRILGRVVQIEKMRGVAIDRQPRPYRITDKGILVHPRNSTESMI